jgi:hypothetical protein
VARWRAIVDSSVFTGAVGDLESSLLGDRAVDERVFDGAADRAFVRPEDAEGLAPVEIGLASPVACRVTGGLVRLGGSS